MTNQMTNDKRVQTDLHVRIFFKMAGLKLKISWERKSDAETIDSPHEKRNEIGSQSHTIHKNHFLVTYRLTCERQNFKMLEANKKKVLYGFKLRRRGS